MDFIHLGTVWGEHNPDGTWGYDGQFYYQIAKDPFMAHRFMDNASYRYQRILYPILAKFVVLGNDHLIPFSLLIVNYFAIVIGVELLSILLTTRGVSRWYSLPFGLYFGQATAFTFDLSGPLAYTLVVVATAFIFNGKVTLSGVFFGLAALTRETTAIYPACFVFVLFAQRKFRDASCMALFGLVPLSLWLFSIRILFGETGLSFAPPMESIPFVGIFSRLDGRGLFSLLVLMMLIPLLIYWFMVIMEFARLPGEPLVLAWFINLTLVTFLSHYSFMELISSGRQMTGAVVAALLHGLFTQNRLILRASLYHIATFPIYVVALWLGIRSLIVH